MAGESYNGTGLLHLMLLSSLAQLLARTANSCCDWFGGCRCVLTTSKLVTGPWPSNAALPVVAAVCTDCLLNLVTGPWPSNVALAAAALPVVATVCTDYLLNLVTGPWPSNVALDAVALPVVAAGVN